MMKGTLGSKHFIVVQGEVIPATEDQYNRIIAVGGVAKQELKDDTSGISSSSHVKYGLNKLDQQEDALNDRKLDDLIRREQVDSLRPDGLASPVSYRFDLIPPHALMKMAEVMEEGARTGHKDEGWRKMSVDDLLNHAVGHIIKYRQGVDDKEDHLSHAMIRLMMAWEKNRDTQVELYSILYSRPNCTTSSQAGATECTVASDGRLK